MEPSTRSRQWLLKTVSIVVGLALTLLLVEGLVTLFFDEPVQPRYVHDGGYGVRANQPGISTVHYVPGDYEVAINTNSASMRGKKKYAVRKPDGTRRWSRC